MRSFISASYQWDALWVYVYGTEFCVTVLGSGTYSKSTTPAGKATCYLKRCTHQDLYRRSQRPGHSRYTDSNASVTVLAGDVLEPRIFASECWLESSWFNAIWRCAWLTSTPFAPFYLSRNVADTITGFEQAAVVLEFVCSRPATCHRLLVSALP